MQKQMPAKVRVAAVQHGLRGLDDPEAFRTQVSEQVRAAAGYACDFIVLPEMFTMQLLSAGPTRLTPAAAMERIATYTDWFVGFMRELAIAHRVNIVAGTHFTRMANGRMRNVAHVFLRDGSLHTREKIHPTPSEAAVWGIEGGDNVDVIETDCGPVGVLICYDAEFPELARRQVDQGALLLLVPFCTDDRRGFLRVRYCCHARAIENQVHVVMAGVVGNLPNVENMDIHYAESAVLTPCDMPFARDGIAAEAAPNVETIVIADLSLDDLLAARREGAVRNLADRRHDLYRVEWRRD